MISVPPRLRSAPLTSTCGCDVVSVGSPKWSVALGATNPVRRPRRPHRRPAAHARRLCPRRPASPPVVITPAALLATAVSLTVTARCSTRTNGASAAATPLVGPHPTVCSGFCWNPFSAESSACSSSFRSSISASGKPYAALAANPPTRPPTYLPGYGDTRLFIDGALTASFDEIRALLIALVWLAVLATAATLLFRHAATGRWWWSRLVEVKPAPDRLHHELGTNEIAAEPERHRSWSVIAASPHRCRPPVG
jgi:hypothetical protein